MCSTVHTCCPLQWTRHHAPSHPWLYIVRIHALSCQPYACEACCSTLQEEQLERCKLDLQMVQQEGAQVLDDVAAMQRVRLAENELRKLDMRVAHAAKLQSTYKALIAQLDKDEANATAELDNMEQALQRSEADIVRLRERAKSAAGQSAGLAAQCSAAKDELQDVQSQHEAARQAKEHAVREASAKCHAELGQVRTNKPVTARSHF